MRALEDFFESGVVALHLVGGDGTILHANRAELDLLGYEAHDYIGRPIADFHADPAAITQILERLGRGERLDKHPARLRRKDGSIRHVLISSNVCFEDGELVHSRCFTFDVTELVEAETALKAEKARLSLATQAARVGVWDYDAKTGAMLYSDEARAICGFDADAPVTLETVRQAIHPDDYEATWDLVLRAVDPAVRYCAPYEYRIVRPDGAVRWVLSQGQALFEPHGDPPRLLRYIGALQDITERRTMADALQVSQARLRRAMEAARMAVWDSEPGSRMDVSSALAARLGIEGDVTLDELRSRYFHAHDGRMPTAARVALQAGERSFETEYEYPDVHDEPGWVLVRGEFEPRVEGEPPRATGVLIDITARRRAEAAMRESEERLRALAANLPNGMIYQLISTPDGGRRFTFVSENCLRVNGVSAEAAMADAASLYGLIHPEDLPAVVEAEERSIATGEGFDREVRMRSPEGEWRWRRLSSAPRVMPDGAILWDGIQIDIDMGRRAVDALHSLNATLEERIEREVAERSRTEEALRQAQKMEAVGQLTGGVAHDFNNLLTVIMGGLDTIRRCRPGDEARLRRATEIAMQGAERAAGLTTRLLAFSRRQPLNPLPIDVNILIRNLTELLHRTLGETIELEGAMAPRLWTAEVDANQLENAILNLALNARDAMPRGGKLTIETANTALDDSYRATDTEVIPGDYVLVSISDTGRGMDADTLARVFEPFFTTKDVGKGTGLGLSMVYGFAKQSGGHVTIYSEPGQGTTVNLYFPRYTGSVRPANRRDVAQPPVGDGEEVVLVVEDNDEVRDYSVTVLKELGYGVVEAADADAALEILATSRRVDLLFTDVVLPGRSGRELAALAAEQRPGLPVLFTTGYARDAIVHHGRLEAGVQLLSKPFTFEQLAARVRDVVDAGQRRATPVG